MVGIKKQSGFSLMELLIVSSIFSVIIVVIASLFVSALRVENRIFATKKVLAQISYATEYMSRALRMAEKDTDGICIPDGTNYRVSVGNEDITFINALQDSNCQKFYLDDGQIKYDINDGADTFELTSSEVVIEDLQFKAHGETQGDSFQPFVTIYFKASTIDSPVLEIQTSVSQRNPDIRR